MAIEIRMPEVAADMTEGDLVTWLVKPGDRVSEGDLIAEIETDKSTVEFESPATGIVVEIVVPAGTAGVRVGEVLALLSESDEARLSPGAPAQPEPSEEAPEPPGAGARPAEAAVTPSAAEAVAAVPATALARRLASQGGVDLATVEGTGAGGRVVKADVEARLAGATETAAPTHRGRDTVPAEPKAKAREREAVPAKPKAKAREREAVPAKPKAKAREREAVPAKPKAKAREREAVPAEPPARQARDTATVEDAFREIPHTRMRKTIARRLSDAKRTIPHFYLRSECRIDDLLELRAELNRPPAEGDSKLSINDFVVRACALALQEVPEANASWGEDALILYERSDIAIAVATEGGLVTPVVRSADRKGLAALSREIRDLAERARAGKLLPTEYQGGTFSVSNLGMYGVDGVYAIVNPPQSCILGVGAGEQRPAVVDGELGVATMMTCTLSADHRVVDGAVAARLLSAIKRRIENPLGMAL